MSPIRPVIRFRAYACGCRCCLLNGSVHSAQLVDIGRESARLRLERPKAESLQLGDRCVLESGISGAPLAPAPCRVEWLSGCDCGVSFDEPCAVGVYALQQALCKMTPRDDGH